MIFDVTHSVRNCIFWHHIQSLLTRFASEMVDQMERYLGEIEDFMPLAFATLLDPRDPLIYDIAYPEP